MESATCYEDRDNSFVLTIKKNDVTLTESEMLAVTKFEIKFDGVYYNTVANPTGFVINNVAGTLKVKPYELVLGATIDNVELILYTAETPHGLVWENFELIMKDDAKTV